MEQDNDSSSDDSSYVTVTITIEEEEYIPPVPAVPPRTTPNQGRHSQAGTISSTGNSQADYQITADTLILMTNQIVKRYLMTLRNERSSADLDIDEICAQMQQHSLQDGRRPSGRAERVFPEADDLDSAIFRAFKTLFSRRTALTLPPNLCSLIEGERRLHRELLVDPRGAIIKARPLRFDLHIEGGNVGQLVWDDVHEDDTSVLRNIVLNAAWFVDTLHVASYRRSESNNPQSRLINMKGLIYSLVNDNTSNTASKLVILEFVIL